MPRDNLLEAPDWLSDAQRAGWNYAIVHAPFGLLKTIDRALLTSWVIAEAVHKEASIKLQNLPLMLMTP